MMQIDPRTILIVTLSALTAGLAIALVQRERTVSQLRESVEKLECRTRDQERRLAMLRPRPDKAPSKPGANGAPPTAPSGPGEKRGTEGARSFLGGLAAMMTQPGMRDSIRQHQELAIDNLYAAFFASADLTPDQRARLRELLAEKHMAGAERGLRILDPNLSKEERAALANEIQDRQKTSDTAIKELLGERAYGEFEMYEKSQPERQQIDSFKRALETDGLELSLEQERGLMDMMYAERTAKPAAQTGPSRMREAVMSGETELSEERINAIIAEQRRLQDEIATRASGILDAEQLAVFKRSQERARAMQETGLRMGSQLFQGGGS